MMISCGLPHDLFGGRRDGRSGFGRGDDRECLETFLTNVSHDRMVTVGIVDAADSENRAAGTDQLKGLSRHHDDLASETGRGGIPAFNGLLIRDTETKPRSSHEV